MTLPTQLTLSRIAVTFVIMRLIFMPGLAAKSWALGLFLLAGLTDWLDGFLARRFKQVSPLGILLDPIADKVLVLGILLACVQLALFPAWMLLVIVLREFLITGVRLYAASCHLMIPAAQEGKQKMVSQMVTLVLILSLLVIRETRTGQLDTFQRWMEPAILIGMWVTVALTVVSGVSFFWRNREVLADVGHRQVDRHRR